MSRTAASECAPEDQVEFTSAAGRWVLLATVLGSSVAMLTSTVVTVALPAIGRDLEAGVGGLQWVVNGYMLALASLILFGGSLSDRYGRRRLFIVGTVWFTVASALCVVAPTLLLLVIARILQGIGGALLTPGSLAIIQATFVRADRPRAIGAWSALGGVAAAIGPAVGGYLVESFSWRAVFLLNVPLAVVAVFATIRHVPESRDPTATGRLDVWGAGVGTLGLAALTYGFIAAGDQGASSSVVLALIVGVVALVAFVPLESRRRSPMLPVDIFSSRQFTSANVLTFLVYGAMGVVFFLLVVFLQEAVGYSAIAAGFAELPVTVLMLLLSARGGELAQRIGPRLPLTVGPLLIAAGFLLLSRLGPDADYLTTVLPGLVLFGLGLVATVAPVTSTVLAAADERHSGVASGVNNAVARTAALIAVAVVPPLVGLTEQDYADPLAFTESFRAAMFLVAGLAGSGGILAFFTISNDVLDEGDADERGAAGTDDGTAIGARSRATYHCAVDGPPTPMVPRAAAIPPSRD